MHEPTRHWPAGYNLPGQIPPGLTSAPTPGLSVPTAMNLTAVGMWTGVGRIDAERFRSPPIAAFFGGGPDQFQGAQISGIAKENRAQADLRPRLAPQEDKRRPRLGRSVEGLMGLWATARRLGSGGELLRPGDPQPRAPTRRLWSCHSRAESSGSSASRRARPTQAQPRRRPGPHPAPGNPKTATRSRSHGAE